MMETEFYFDTAQIIALALRCILDILLPFAAFYYLHKKQSRIVAMSFCEPRS